MKTEHLQRRGRQWYLKLGIPRPLQHHFKTRTGKPMTTIDQPLGDSYELARVECGRRVADFRELFVRLKAGELIPPEQIAAVLQKHQRLANAAEMYARVRAEYAHSPLSLTFIDAAAKEFGFAPTTATTAPASTGETISQAADALIKEIERTKPRASTLKDLRDQVDTFIDWCGGDLPLTAVDRAKAADFLDGLKVSTARRNTYALTLKRVYKCAARRGRFSKQEEDNPFHDQRLKVTKGETVPRDRFTIPELQALFDALPRDINPKKNTPETAVPWVALMAAYTGMCLEEICQLTVDDIREEKVNGGMLVCIDIHNGDDGHKLKNEDARPRLLPIHPELERAGLLDFAANMRKQGHNQLFPGLKRRKSKDNKIGPRVGELFNKKRRALGITRKGKKLDFHSFRHTVSNTLERAGVSQTDAARVLGHTIEGMSYGNYSEGGPGLLRVRGVIEQITYEGLRV
jgi:integrase